GFLIASAFYQNSVYINAMGLTYKRLGVYLFLIICLIGLVYSFLKIHQKRTNFYLIDRMSWTIFYSLIFCSIFNWGNIMTNFNLKKDKVDWNYLTNDLSGNEKTLLNYYKKQIIEVPALLLNRL